MSCQSHDVEIPKFEKTRKYFFEPIFDRVHHVYFFIVYVYYQLLFYTHLDVYVCDSICIYNDNLFNIT